MRKQAQRGEPDGKSQQEADPDLNLNPSASPAAGPTPGNLEFFGAC